MMASAKEPRSQVVDFTTPDAFESVLVNVDTLKSGEEINVALIKKKSILYRAGSVNARTADESAPGWNSPLFMSDLESIAPYRNSGRALMRGITKKNLVLFILEMDNIVKILGELYGKSDKPELFAEFITGYLVKSNDSLEMPDAIIPAQRPPPEFAEKFYPGMRHFAYNNRIFAELICSAGYDGWISFPENSLKQRNLDVAEFRKSGELKYKYNPYAPEVVICKPNDNLIHGPIRSSSAVTASVTASTKGTPKGVRKCRVRTRNKNRTKNKRR